MNAHDRQWMQRALDLAAQGIGHVEPNPMVGCVVVQNQQAVGEGWHRRFGGPHAEIEALKKAGQAARGATLYVTLEPCCHHGKTPPCSEAIVRAGVHRVVAAMADPFPQVAGGGLEQLRNAGIAVEVGLLEHQAQDLNAAYLCRLQKKRPWVLAKWAMTCDGKIATHTGDSQWISSEESRAEVHRLRGRMDAIIIGRRTLELDDPLLTARPPGPRIATRIVCDTDAQLSLDSQLVRTARQTPVLVAAAAGAETQRLQRLQRAGCDVWQLPGKTYTSRLQQLLERLADRAMSNVLVEGGSRLLGSFFDAQLIDEVHVFIAPKLVGGSGKPPILGEGVPLMQQAKALNDPKWKNFGKDLYLFGRLS